MYCYSFIIFSSIFLLISLDLSMLPDSHDKQTTKTQSAAASKIPVFPEAQGFGTTTPAGRGGTIRKVTNLKDSGLGSLRSALEFPGARIIVFEVGGEIKLSTDLIISSPFITVAGQTAPSPGITLRGAGIRILTHDVLIQHMRIRVGDAAKGPNPDNRDAIQILGPSNNVVIDQISASWAIDENISTWHKDVHDITISNSIISEGLSHSLHSKIEHSKGLLIGDWSKKICIIRNLFAHNKSRNPRVKGGTSSIITNNLIYNPGGEFISITDDYAKLPVQLAIVGNVFIDGPQTANKISAISIEKSTKYGSLIFIDNNLTSQDLLSLSNKPTFNAVVNEPPLWIDGLKILSPKGLENFILTCSGARPNDRDDVDRRISLEVKARTGKIIDSQSQVGGWPENSSTYRIFNLPPDPSGDLDGDGYTNIEEIIQLMSKELQCPTN